MQEAFLRPIFLCEIERESHLRRCIQGQRLWRQCRLHNELHKDLSYCIVLFTEFHITHKL